MNSIVDEADYFLEAIKRKEAHKLIYRKEIRQLCVERFGVIGNKYWFLLGIHLALENLTDPRSDKEFLRFNQYKRADKLLEQFNKIKELWNAQLRNEIISSKINRHKMSGSRILTIDSINDRFNDYLHSKYFNPISGLDHERYEHIKNIMFEFEGSLKASLTESERQTPFKKRKKSTQRTVECMRAIYFFIQSTGINKDLTDTYIARFILELLKLDSVNFKDVTNIDEIKKTISDYKKVINIL